MLDPRIALRIAELLATAPEDRLPMIKQVLSLVDKDQWPSQPFDAPEDLEQFLEGLTADRETVKGRYQIRCGDFNGFCLGQRVSPVRTKKQLAEQGLIRVFQRSDGVRVYSGTCRDPGEKGTYRAVCLAADWREKL